MKNADFKQNPVNGKVTGWTTLSSSLKPGRNACIFKKGTAVLSLEPGEKMIALIQRYLPLEPGKEYRLTFEAKGTEGTLLSDYIEWVLVSGKYGSSGTFKRKLTPEWKTCSSILKIPNLKSNFKSAPYFAFCMKEPGKAEIRNAVLEEAVSTNTVQQKTEPNEKLILNPEFIRKSASGPVSNWTIITQKIKPGRQACRFDNGTASLSLESGETMVALVQHKVKLVPGARYRLSFDACGSKGLKFRSYFEWYQKNGKYGNSKTMPFLGTGEWKKYSFEFQTLPKGTEYRTSSPYLAFTLNLNPGNLKVKNPLLTELRTHSGIADSGFDNPKSGAWKLGKNSRILSSGGHTSPGVLALSGKNAEASLNLLLSPGKMYRLNYFVKGRNNTETTSGFSDYLCVLHLNGKLLWGTDQKQDCFQSSWQGRSQIIRVPKGQSGQLNIMLKSLSTGDVLFDDFLIEETKLTEEKPLEILLTQPAYRNMIFSSDPIDSVRGTIATKQAVKSVSVTFNGKTVSVQPGKEFSFPAKNLKTGKYEIVATAQNPEGKQLTDKVIIRKLPRAKNEVVYNSKKQLLVNGKPFFACGVNNLLSQVPHSPVIDYYVRRTGSCVSRWAGWEDLKRRLDLCQQSGIKVSLDLSVVNRYIKAKNMENFKVVWKKLLARLNEVKQHPALIEYYAFDEPLWNGTPPEVMKYVYESLKEMDPYHPVAYIEAPRGTPDAWRPYAQYSDTFGIDIYPVPAESNHSELPEKGLRSVGLYTQLATEALNGRKPVKMYLQAFDWGCLAAKRKSFHRSPTQEEFRFMNFDAILHGCSSVIFYRDKNIDLEAEKYMYRELNLFNRFVPALMFGEQIQCKTESSGMVMTKITKYKGNRYMVVLNRGDEAGSVILPDDVSWYQIEPGKSIPVKTRKFELPKLSCRLFFTAKELPLENTIPENAEMEKLLPALFNYICLRPKLLDPAAKWIWNADPQNKLFCNAFRKFTVSKPVKKAVLRMTADDEFTCFLDKKEILSGNDWKHLFVCDLADKLKLGPHLLTVHVANHGGPGGLVGDFVIEYKDGSKEVIVTDSSWTIASGKSAKEIAPLGKGPWRF